MRLRSNAQVDRRNGGIALSPQTSSLIRPANAAVVVTGTCSAGYNRVFVSLQMVGAADGRILAGADYSVPLGNEVEGLLCRRVAGDF
ncbi:MAG: hypothetical protein EXR05_03110 [Acetobacteraceae bacterium]|nr:hypothetical protein [Acetobacteraceae bacterium]